MVETKKAAADTIGGEAVLMTNQLQDLLEREEFTKALKYCGGRKLSYMSLSINLLIVLFYHVYRSVEKH